MQSSHSLRRLFALVTVTTLFSLLSACSDPTKNAGSAVHDPRLTEFARLKHQQFQELAAKLQVSETPDVRQFFEAAETADWRALQRYEKDYRRTEQSDPRSAFLGLTDALFVPVAETLGADHAGFLWDATLLPKFADGILYSIPPGSVYFGGTDAGRYSVTHVWDTSKTPDIFILSQNVLAEPRYMDYLRLVDGAKLTLPTVTDAQAAYQRYIDEYYKDSARPGVHVSVGIDGRMSVQGVGGVMAINATLTKWIFDHNKDQHEFYVEESYVLDWMMPYLEPHGLIMKLNREPLAKLAPAVILQDRQFWDVFAKGLLSDPLFLANNEARKIFSKLRAAIGGLYLNRRLFTEAEAAFKQALELDPLGPEVSFRLARLYAETQRFNEAIQTMEQLRNGWTSATAVDRQHIDENIEHIRALKRNAEPR